jgi:hypothetical protein
MKSSNIFRKTKIVFTVDDKPPKKSKWGGKNANLVIKLRKAALEARKKVGLNKCISESVSLKLTVYAPNIDDRNYKQSGDEDLKKYIGDLDSLVAGVCDYLSSVRTEPGENKFKPSPLFEDEPDINPKFAILIDDDSHIKIISAEKKKSKNDSISYKVEIKSLS